MTIVEIAAARHIDLVLPNSRKRIPVTFLRVEGDKVRVLSQRTGAILDVEASELVEPKLFTPRQRRMIRQGMREQVARGHW